MICNSLCIRCCGFSSDVTVRLDIYLRLLKNKVTTSLSILLDGMPGLEGLSSCQAALKIIQHSMYS